MSLLCHLLGTVDVGLFMYKEEFPWIQCISLHHAEDHNIELFVCIQIEVWAIFKFEFVGSIKLYVQAGIVISKRKHYLVVLQQLAFLEKLVDSIFYFDSISQLEKSADLVSFYLNQQISFSLLFPRIVVMYIYPQEVSTKITPELLIKYLLK